MKKDEEVNVYDDEHDWCYAAANLYCGKKLDVAETLRTLAPSLSPEVVRHLILALQNEHLKLFDAFVHGAVFGKKSRESTNR